MSYYPTLREDVERAKVILAEGRAEAPTGLCSRHQTPDPSCGICFAGGTIYGKDTYAAYMLLQSFVEVIETMDVKVCELALRARKRGAELAALEEIGQRADDQVEVIPLHGIPAGLPDEQGPTTRPDYLGLPRDIGDAPAECVCRTRGCGHPASEHDGHGGCKLCQRLHCWS